MRGLHPFLEVDIKLMASEAEIERLKGQLRRMTAERDKIAERLKAARAKSKADREAIAVMIEDEVRLFKSTAPCLIVPGYDPAAAHLVGLELEHLARKVRQGRPLPLPASRGGGILAT